ncbi:hypothetical protein J7337_005842 [Fusarium musae]|uniref:Uncharacterized protein n=1 Tax=Fusarium musae TaxID=1042133 RepID=A0A9P8DJ65_9HYPO|nr:hypothetical protein J7337_005842 [Fusarium musae]KAG9503005.1 hypothetical protein J7337_005842 [Fusarium musae]
MALDKFSYIAIDPNIDVTRIRRHKHLKMMGRVRVVLRGEVRGLLERKIIREHDVRQVDIRGADPEDAVGRESAQGQGRVPGRVVGRGREYGRDHGQGCADVLGRVRGVKPERERIALPIVHYGLGRELVQLQSAIHDRGGGLGWLRMRTVAVDSGANRALAEVRQSAALDSVSRVLGEVLHYHRDQLRLRHSGLLLEHRHVPDLHDPRDAVVALDRPYASVGVFKLDPLPVHGHIPLRELGPGDTLLHDRDRGVVGTPPHGPVVRGRVHVHLSYPPSGTSRERLRGHKHVRLELLARDDILDGVHVLVRDERPNRKLDSASPLACLRSRGYACTDT